MDSLLVISDYVIFKHLKKKKKDLKQ